MVNWFREHSIKSNSGDSIKHKRKGACKKKLTRIWMYEKTNGWNKRPNARCKSEAKLRPRRKEDETSKEIMQLSAYFNDFSSHSVRSLIYLLACSLARSLDRSAVQGSSNRLVAKLQSCLIACLLACSVLCFFSF